MKSAAPSLAECYRILGVPQGASLDEIKHAYRTKAFALHPDLNPSAGASRQFQQLNEAYVILIRLLDSRAGGRKASGASPSPDERTSRKGREAYREQQERERKEKERREWQEAERQAREREARQEKERREAERREWLRREIERQEAERLARQEQARLLVLDEVCAAVNTGLLPLEEVISLPGPCGGGSGPHRAGPRPGPGGTGGLHH